MNALMNFSIYLSADRCRGAEFYFRIINKSTYVPQTFKAL